MHEPKLKRYIFLLHDKIPEAKGFSIIFMRKYVDKLYTYV